MSTIRVYVTYAKNPQASTEAWRYHNIGGRQSEITPMIRTAIRIAARLEESKTGLYEVRTLVRRPPIAKKIRETES